jgi:branched-chain amino acid transport system ATP-binding protein
VAGLRAGSLSAINLSMAPAEAVALAGPNGSGKTTLLRALAGLTPVVSGSVTFHGRDVTHLSPAVRVRRGLVLVPAGGAVFRSMTVEDNLLAACHPFAWDRAAVTSRVERALMVFPTLRSRLAQPAATLSGGEQQMLALAKGFVAEPRLLMIDELTLGLAPTVVVRLVEALRTMNRQGTALLVAAAPATLAARVVTLERGEVVEDRPPPAPDGVQS